jgi:hypothetical protein
MSPTNKNQLWFTHSTRFLASLIGCIAIAYGPDGLITPPEVYNALLALSAAFITLRTAHNIEDIARKPDQLPEL